MEKIFADLLEVVVRKGVLFFYVAMLLLSLVWWTIGSKLGIMRSLRWAISAQPDQERNHRR